MHVPLTRSKNHWCIVHAPLRQLRLSAQEQSLSRAENQLRCRFFSVGWLRPVVSSGCDSLRARPIRLNIRPLLTGGGSRFAAGYRHA